MNSSRSKRLKTIGIAIAAVAVLGVVLIAVRWNTPTLRVIPAASQVRIDVSTLGEYPTTVKRIRLSELRGRVVVWELSADGEAQTHGFVLSEGENPVQIEADYGRYRVATPPNSPHFILHRGMDYKLESWGTSSALSRKSAVIRIGE